MLSSPTMHARDVAGKTVVLTGKFATLKRAEAEAALTALGAKVSDSISRTTDVLFAGDKAGAKLAKATQLGITIHDEATLAALLAGAQPAPAPPPPDAAASSIVTPVSAFAGKSVALTGTFTTMKRAAAEQLLVAAGAKIASGVTRTTQILIHGDNAGSKLDKASSLGVALMSEAEMVALLTAGGVGAGELAGASAKLAEAAADATGMTAVVAELRAFLHALRQREDITVEEVTLGRKASKARLDQLRAQHVPADLLELYAEVDGIVVEWRFTEPPGGGHMRIPAITEWSRFVDDDRSYMNFGDDQEALLLDEITPEGTTWLVRKQGERGTATIIFASAAEGAEGVVAAASIADYLRKAMQSGFVPYWPRCFRPNRYVSYAAQEAMVRRFQAAPVAPTGLVIGSRVQFEYFSGGGRGEVLSLRDIPASDATSFTGTRFVEVRADEGSVAWIPQKWLKAWSGSDAYEQLRAPGRPLMHETGDLGAQLDELARAIDPLGHYTAMDPVGSLPSNARRAAGLLGARPLTEAVTQVLALSHAVRQAKLERREQRPLAQTGREFNPVELARHRWTYNIDGLLEGLHAGLVVLAHHASAGRGVPGRELLPAKLVQQLASCAGAKELHARCTSATPLAAPRWGYQDSKGPPSGLPADAVVWSGDGF